MANKLLNYSELVALSKLPDRRVLAFDGTINIFCGETLYSKKAVLQDIKNKRQKTGV
jgi:hypothetical protein